MGKTYEYTIMGPPKAPDEDSPRLSSKVLPYRKDSKGATPNLRSLYSISAQVHPDIKVKEQSSGPVSSILHTSPNLPPTPPGASNGDIADTADDNISDAAVFRSTLVTPTHQQSLPTPDNTPPREKPAPLLRPFLGTQPSMTSTGAESFQTAREDINSDNGSDLNNHNNSDESQWTSTPFTKPSTADHGLKRSGVGLSPLNNVFDEDTAISPSEDHLTLDQTPETHVLAPTLMESDNGKERFQASPQTLSEPQTPEDQVEEENALPRLATWSGNIQKGADKAQPRETATSNGLGRGRSLRDRLLDAQTQDPSASTEKFAEIIGWNNSVPMLSGSPEAQKIENDETRRWSGVSATSTIGAYVIEQNPLPKRKTTLRHMNKHESLRSVSSPLPASTRNSMMTTASESTRRLVHKKAVLSNQNRWSFGSEVSRSHSLASSAVLPKTEIIRVAVIPERTSSLPSSHYGSNRHSMSAGSAQSQSRRTSDNPPSSWQHKRAFSESTGRGRERQPEISVPPRSSSLSAPTSRSTSCANSITSEHLRVRRQQAEKDLRKTLDRMESDRLVQTLRDWRNEDHKQVSAAQTTSSKLSPSVTRNHWTASDHGGNWSNNEWADLRPPSILETVFSHPSFLSASPEINEAKAVNFFPHNNHSLQLIEPFPVQTSRAVREVQRQNLPLEEVESPLRNPRRPPEPPQFKVIPPTPGDELDKELSLDAIQANRPTRSPLRRPGRSHRRSESFIDSISRNLSLKNARNRKADQELDGRLHPFWRPRAFWDDIDDGPAYLEQDRPSQRGIVSNSLGLPQERTVITGPVSLVRRISERRRQKRGIVKQSSHGSLARLRASRRLHKSHGLGLRFHLIGLRDIQQRLLQARAQRDDEKREKRRAHIRQSIGPNVVPQGDSRFPASDTSLSRIV
ncbi:hypothetical protein HRR83_008585 [Exophiala dermatitidis]|uniref:Uncharacterized protein n=1 Tax=Exophiala dermatitidis TaxID=5970 RepID=A0AAN6EXW2_EXODE|nr:hypothetical protein HRR75_007790 [Exophiala dermatitidis]KAJ4505586.1 hypothetical protein HRR73_008400 [Exophiala dermatitidis]KAJ4506050.1 hypothetical protein HRR74_008480 [Exophiala dermatitidis]KAJ4536572.1 hypothetical protein HRR76_004606 [Exophiala dermatitidis]KAJ4555822.1 hypothetical protein HRR77_001744 [Exophiala dermatitidis]